MQVNINDRLLQYGCPYMKNCRETPTIEHLVMHRQAVMMSNRQSSIDWVPCRYNSMHMIPRVEIKLHENFCTSKLLHDQIIDAISDRRHDDNSKLSIDEQRRCISVDSGYIGGGASSQHISPANSQVFSELDENETVATAIKPAHIYVDPKTNQLYGDVEMFGDDDEEADARPSIHIDTHSVKPKTLLLIPLKTSGATLRGRGRGRIKG